VVGVGLNQKLSSDQKIWNIPRFDFDRALAYALSCVKQGGFSLKDQQVEAVKLLSEGKDVFVWFPTSYGKSICYQLLPFVFDIKLGRTNAPLWSAICVKTQPFINT